MFVNRFKNFPPKRHKLKKMMELSYKMWYFPLNLTKEGRSRNKFWLRNIVNYILFGIRYKYKEYGCFVTGCMR